MVMFARCRGTRTGATRESDHHYKNGVDTHNDPWPKPRVVEIIASVGVVDQLLPERLPPNRGGYVGVRQFGPRGNIGTHDRALVDGVGTVEQALTRSRNAADRGGAQ